jgi:sialic acid synthase SpsE
MQRAFQLPVGYSDHTLGIEICLAAVALGATLIEKHVTLERGLPGPDHRASLEMKDLSRLVQGIRAVESSLGHGRKEPAERESRTAQVVRKSLVAARNLPTGTRLTAEMISVKRPGTGLDPEKRSLLIGRCLRVPVQTGDLLSLEMVA